MLLQSLEVYYWMSYSRNAQLYYFNSVFFCLTNGSEAWNENSAKEMTKGVGEELKGKTNE